MRDELRLDNTVRALAWYDSTQPARDAKGESVETDRDVELWMAEERLALNTVRNAFFEDTKDRNSRSGCDVVSLSFIRELVSKYGRSE